MTFLKNFFLKFVASGEMLFFFLSVFLSLCINVSLISFFLCVSMSLFFLSFSLSLFLSFFQFVFYEESVVDKFKSNLLLLIFWLHIINYNSELIK
jgi:hypothetical protein